MQRGGLFRPSIHPSSFDGITRSVASSIVKAAAAQQHHRQLREKSVSPWGSKDGNSSNSLVWQYDSHIILLHPPLALLQTALVLRKNWGGITKVLFIIIFPIFFLQARYTGFRDRPLHERQAKFQQACREGQIELVRKFYLIWKKNTYWDFEFHIYIWPKTIQTFLNFIGHFIQRIHILFDVERLRKRLFGSSCHDSNRF